MICPRIVKSMRGAFLGLTAAIFLLVNAARADEPATPSPPANGIEASAPPAPTTKPEDECARRGAQCTVEDGSSRRRYEFFPSGHLAFGMGGAASAEHPFRLGLDASAGLVAANDFGGWTFAPSLVTGFGKYPTYTSFDFGHVFFAGDGEYGAFAGLILTAGPALRLDPNVGAGAEFSARVYLIVVQLGVRAITIFTNGEEVQIQGTAGIGFM
jgi:hypothetical protein